MLLFFGSECFHFSYWGSESSGNNSGSGHRLVSPSVFCPCKLYKWFLLPSFHLQCFLRGFSSHAPLSGSHQGLCLWVSPSLNSPTHVWRARSQSQHICVPWSFLSKSVLSLRQLSSLPKSNTITIREMYLIRAIFFLFRERNDFFTHFLCGLMPSVTRCM